MATTNFVPGTVVTADWLNDMDGFFYQASSYITGAIERNGLSKNSDYVSVLDYGATGDGTTNDLPAIQLALDSNAGKRRVYFPTPTAFYSVEDTIRIPSNSHLFGDSRATLVKMAASVVRNKSLVVTGHLGDHRSHIFIRDMTFDYNTARNENLFGTGLGDGSGNVQGSGDGADKSCVAICNSSYVYIKNVAFKNGWKHSLDITSPSYVDSVSVNVYDTEPSYNIFVDDCYFTGGGDDNLTTHHSYNIWINNPVSENPSGLRTNDNSNCIEIDDGSRYVFINNALCVGGVSGLQIKGHDEAPAPYSVIVNGIRCINNIIGVEMRHTNYYGVLAEDDGTAPPVLNEDGDPVAALGVSPSARNVILNNVHIIAPRNTMATYSSTYDDPVSHDNPTPTNPKPEGVTLKAAYGMRISSYEHVTINNLIISDGTTDYAEDFLPYIDMDGVPLRVYRGTRKINMNNVTIKGFQTGTFGFGAINSATDLWDDPLPDGQQAAILFSGSFSGGANINNLNIIDGPKIGIRATAGTDNVYLDNFNITSDNADTSGSYGVYFTGSTTNKRVGQGYVSGFRNTVYNETANVSVRKSMVGTGAIQEGLNFVWEEGMSNATAAGEGISLDWKVRLVADTQDYSVARFVTKKLNANDAQRTSDLYGQVSVDGTADPVDVLRLGVDKSAQTYGARYVNVRAVVTAAATDVMTATDHMIVTTGTTTHIFTLPACSTGRTLMFKNNSTGTITINRAGADTIDNGLTTTTIIANAGRLMVGNGTNWCQVANV